MKKIFTASFLAIAVLLSMAAIPSLRFPIYTVGPRQILHGSAVMTADGSVTQAFSTAFGAVPNVIMIQQNNAAASTTNFVTPATNSVILRSSIAGATSIWIAVGAP